MKMKMKNITKNIRNLFKTNSTEKSNSADILLASGYHIASMAAIRENKYESFCYFMRQYASLERTLK